MSSVLACFVLCCTLQLGQSSVASFVVGNRKFDHLWKTKRNMPGKRSDMTATTVDDAIYIIGGCVLDQIWVNDPPYSEYRCGGGSANAITNSTLRYFPKTNSFDTALPAAPRPRYRHAAAALDKKIYLFGGTGESGSIVEHVDVFDTVSGTWTTLVDAMPSASTDLSAFTYSGKIYVVGGYDASWRALNTVQIFNRLRTPTWETGPQLLQGRGDAFSAVVGNNAYMVGGFHDENNFVSPVADLEMLDLAVGTAWVAKSNMSLARGDKAVATLNDILHVVGGETKNVQGHSVPLRDVEAYDPITNAWHFGGDIPSERFRFVASAYGSSIYIFGGQGYLIGQHGSDGSKYPVVDIVEEYSETVTAADASMSVSMFAPSASSVVVVSVMLSILS
mmetsp:Transcript_83006/g.130939  ORF Transcript_83006/g.130939 Transcript_83006/m.130939 type:complete len:391 (+) Transcript_83006:111-1283(+)